MNLPKNTIVVEVRGGIVGNVFSSHPEDAVLIIDWDDLNKGGKPHWVQADTLGLMQRDTKNILQKKIKDLDNSNKQHNIS